MAEVIIIGAGAAGVAAALQLVRRGLKPLILDVGLGPDETARVQANLYEHRRQQDTFDLQIGPRYQALNNLLGEEPVPVKLASPNFEYVTRHARELGPVAADGFHPIQSFAMGGLANAWGAGLYRFTDEDLVGFPFSASDLEPYFETLTAEIGISGAEDDLAPFFGSAAGLLPPLRLSRNAASLYQRYEKRRLQLHHQGIYFGMPRTAVLSQPYGGRPACEYRSLEFWQESPSLYTPRLTLEKLIRAGQVDYQAGCLVESFREGVEGVQVDCLRLPDRQPARFTAKAVLLAAGAINSARLALRSAGDTQTVLPLLENPAVQVPFVLPASLGRPLDTTAFGLVQLNLVWQREGEILQGSIMEITSPMRAEFFSSFPLAACANLAAIRHLLPAMMVMQFYYPGTRPQAAQLSLRPDGRLQIKGEAPVEVKAALKPLLAAFRRLGAWTHPALIVAVPMGHAIHYAGTLPMDLEPSPYTCEAGGRLRLPGQSGAGRIFVADSASFPRLPAKNMSFGMMANAMRIANEVTDQFVPAQVSAASVIGVKSSPAQTVLVTGASGFIGRSLGPTLQAAGLRTLGLARSDAPLPGYDRVFCAHLGDSIADLLRAEPVAAVVHCAHASGSGEYETNLTGTRRWLQEAQEAGAGLHLFLSSLSAQKEALADYGRVKFALESDFLEAGGVVFRLGLVVGDGGMYARLRQPLRQSRFVPLLDNGRGLLYVLGLGTLGLILRDALVSGGEGLRGHILAPHQPQPVTLKELLGALRRVQGYPATFIPVPSLPVLWALQAIEKLQLVKLPVTSTNVRGLRQGYPPGLRSDYARFGYPVEPLEALVKEAGA